MIEQWRPVLGFEALYEVSDLGRVRGTRRQGSAGGIVAPSGCPKGYEKVCLYNRGRKARWVHRLVLEAFVGAAPAGLLACHRNGNPSDNRLQNLRWDTPAANYDDARRHGTATVGNRNPMFRANDAMRATILQMRGRGSLQREIAAAVGLSQQHVSALLKEIAQ